MDSSQKKLRNRVIVALVLFVVFYAAELTGCFDSIFGEGALWAEFIAFLIPFAIAGYDVVINAFKSLARGNGLAEDFLMTIATLGAFALVLFPDSEPHMAEGAAVMIFFQVGELFQSYAVGKSRKSISDMMDIAPVSATVYRDGVPVEVDPYDVQVGDTLLVRNGEKIPLDGRVTKGATQLDTSALTGESAPREVSLGEEVLSGCINQGTPIEVEVTKPYEDSTVARILELVEDASSRKARTEAFITRFARYYTPIVVGLAVAIAVIGSIVTRQPSDWILRGLTFLVVSCPCALVISVPLSFFGGIGGASKAGILVKGSNYLEALSKVDTVIFDKTGTLTRGTFEVIEIDCADEQGPDELMTLAGALEAFSTHPIATCIVSTAKNNGEGKPERTLPTAENVTEVAGKGIKGTVNDHVITLGSFDLIDSEEKVATVATPSANSGAPEVAGTVINVGIDGRYAGRIILGDIVKPTSAEAIASLHAAGVSNCIMLTGDNPDVARQVSAELKLDDFKAGLLPQDKVAAAEELIEKTHAHNANLAFVGDGINDAPVLMRSDVGIAMGAMGSDAAIEAADIVLMDDNPQNVALAMRISKKTMRIVWQNIIFALAIKFAVLILAALGLANMWMAVFADVGVCVIAILNAMRAMRI
jgi:Cd2+/Zn2+-exporting ATPase